MVKILPVYQEFRNIAYDYEKQRKEVKADVLNANSIRSNPFSSDIPKEVMSEFKQKLCRAEINRNFDSSFLDLGTRAKAWFQDEENRKLVVGFWADWFIPEELIQCPNLQDLWIQGSREFKPTLTTNTKSLQHLKTLNISWYGKKMTVPPSIGTLSSLQRLQLDGAVEYLPKGLKEVNEGNVRVRISHTSSPLIKRSGIGFLEFDPFDGLGVLIKRLPENCFQ